jgi:cytoskeletal protein CcmA (bactofilin family)
VSESFNGIYDRIPDQTAVKDDIVFFKRRAQKSTENAPPTPKRRFSDEFDSSVSVVAAGITLKGEISGADSLEIFGFVDGNVAVRGLCRIGEAGRVLGRISAHHVIVEGNVEGKISARQRIELRAHAKVQAEISAESVAMAEGAFFDGRIHMRNGGAQMAFQEKRRVGADEPGAR